MRPTNPCLQSLLPLPRCRYRMTRAHFLTFIPALCLFNWLNPTSQDIETYCQRHVRLVSRLRSNGIAARYLVCSSSKCPLQLKSLDLLVTIILDSDRGQACIIRHHASFIFSPSDYTLLHHKVIPLQSMYEHPLANMVVNKLVF